MSRASYLNAIAWIALNDEPTDMDPESIKGQISTLLVADTWEKDPREVAEAIVNYRNRRKDNR